MAEEKREVAAGFTPYVPAGKSLSEMTVTSVLTGALLAVAFGAANAYLGLRVGLTVSASIPAAVISMGLLRLLRRRSVLENNLVQTIGSAGESVAAGAVFTLPCLFLWSREGLMAPPSVLEMTAIALVGGLLGVLFMVPLREALIVREHGKVPYPEGTACAEVLLAGEKGGRGALMVGLGLFYAAAVKFLLDGLKAVGSTLVLPCRFLRTAFLAEAYPALTGVGYICGFRIASYMFAGGLLSWFVIIPMIALFGGDMVLFPGKEPISEIYASGGPSALWSLYVRYIGAGMVAMGGFISLAKSMPVMGRAFAGAMRGFGAGGAASGTELPGYEAGNFLAGPGLRTERQLRSGLLLFGILACVLAVWLMPQLPTGLPGALLVAVFGFFFATVSARMVGLVGSSSNPISGMTIATLVLATMLLKLWGLYGPRGLAGAISIASVTCIVAAVAGDTSQDLKTGHLLGASPWKQQLGECIGVAATALVIGFVLKLLDSSLGFGSPALAAPQATLMKVVSEGVMAGNLPWPLILIGVALAIFVELLGLPVLPVAMGAYLPLATSAPIMLGGLARLLMDRGRKGEGEQSDPAILFCSGLVAGEGLMGILIAGLAGLGALEALDCSGFISLGLPGTCLALAATLGAIAWAGRRG